MGFWIVDTIRLPKPHTAHSYGNNEPKCSKLSIILSFALFLLVPCGV